MTPLRETGSPPDPTEARQPPPSTTTARDRSVAIAADHGGFPLKVELLKRLRGAGFVTRDFGANELVVDDDYPDLIVPMARAVALGSPPRGIAICGSGVGACVAANKIPGVRAALCADTYSARQGVEDDDMNVLCVGARVTGPELAWELVRAFLAARFRTEERFRRRLEKVTNLERSARDDLASSPADRLEV